jgi:hypothetical protein
MDGPVMMNMYTNDDIKFYKEGIVKNIPCEKVSSKLG